MEEDAVAFLKRISMSILIGIVWMGINSTAGIMFDLAFVHDKISAGNIIFYIWFILSISAMIWLYIRLWGKRKEEF